MSEYTPTTDYVREVFSSKPGGDYVKQHLIFNRWLWAHNAKLVTEFMQQPEFQEMLATRDAATRTAALEEAAGIADRSRPEIGSHINGSPYRSGKYDAAVLVAVAIRAAKDGAQ